MTIKKLDGEASPKKAKRKLKPGMGKAKGSGFEGVIAKKLSVALAPLTFIRSPGSGARVGGKNFETFGKMFGEDALKLFVADVVATNEKDSGLTFKHSIECKSYAKSDSFETMVAGNANIFKWFQESVTDAAKIDKNPLLIFKWNHTPIYVIGLFSSMPQNPRIVLSQNDVTLSVFYFDDLITTPDFWYTKHNGQ